MSLIDLMKTGLPLNRKERYFTGTVFPMIVCANGFRDLGVLASLIPGCRVPQIDPDPRSANIQFFTEYSLVESIHGKETKARFPHPPKTKDTPDVMILVRGEKTVLVAIEAKMYHQPQLHALVKQMQAQRAQLDYLKECLVLDAVWHAALLPAGFAPGLGDLIPNGAQPGFPVIRWEDVLARYRDRRGEDDYFMGMLDLALKSWENLSSQPLAYGANAEAKRRGGEIVRHFQTDASLNTMGRSGGLTGPLLAADVRSGSWRSQDYEVSSAPEPVNSNWFYVKDFVRLVTAAPAESPTATPFVQSANIMTARVARARLTGDEILASRDDPAVRIVGRQGGLRGMTLAEDVQTDRWRAWRYEVSPAPEPLNANWFSVEDFVALVGVERPTH